MSFETVLAREGVIFQVYNPIFVASYTKKDLDIDHQVSFIPKNKRQGINNSDGILHISETSIATKERALLDTLYVNMNVHFDNLRSLDWERVFEILPVYQNQRMTKKVNSIYKMVS